MDAQSLGLVADFDPVERIRADSLALADAAEGDMTARVRSCPDWSTADLVWHLREVHSAWGAIVRDGLTDPSQVVQIERPEGDARLLADFRDGVEELAGVLAAADPFAPVWTWGRRHDAGFVVRHQVQEAAVHRWDAEDAVGVAGPLHALAAADGVDEFLEHSLPGREDGAPALGGVVVLRSQDTGHGWRVEEGADGTAVAERLDGYAPGVEVEPGTTTVAGSASDLLLYLYRRVPATTLAVTGDMAVAASLPLRTATD